MSDGDKKSVQQSLREAWQSVTSRVAGAETELKQAAQRLVDDARAKEQALEKRIDDAVRTAVARVRTPIAGEVESLRRRVEALQKKIEARRKKGSGDEGGSA